MGGRYDLTDFEWSIIEPLLPNKPRGVPRADDRRVLNGIFWRLRSGAPWRDIPERYGPYTTCYNRFVRWRKGGVWDRIMDAITAAYDGDIQMIDSSSVRVHQHAANVKKNDGIHCMGRSRGGLTTKIHAVVDAAGQPIRLALSPGQAWDGSMACDLLDQLGEGSILLADRAYDSNAIRDFVTQRGAWPNIPPMSHRRETFAFSRWVYRQRNAVERFFNKIKQFRAIATRYEKLAENYLALIKIAAIRICLRNYESMA